MDTHTLELLDFDKVRTWSRRARPARWARRRPSGSNRASTLARSTTGRRLPPRWSRHSPRACGPPSGDCTIFASLCAEPRREACSRPKSSQRPSRRSARSAISTAGSRRSGDQFPRLGGLRNGVGEFSGGCCRHRRMPRQSRQGARHSQPAARGLAARDRPRGGSNPRNTSADAPFARNPAGPPLSQFHDGGASLCVARGQGQARRGPGLGPSHQLQQRDCLRRADGHRRTVGAALVSPRQGIQGSAPDSPLADRPGRDGVRPIAGGNRHHGRARPGPCPGSAEPRLSNVAATCSTRRAGLVLRAARHPLLEALFRGDPALVEPPRPEPAAAGRSIFVTSHPRGRPARVFGRTSRARIVASVARCSFACASNRDADRSESGSPVPHPGRHRPEHRRQDGGSEDSRTARGHGPVRLACPGRGGVPAPGLRRCPRRYRRRAKSRAVALDFLVARATDQRDLDEGFTAVVRVARRAGSGHRPDRRRGPGPRDPRRARVGSAAARSSPRTSAT